jgi:hypothetical protein
LRWRDLRDHLAALATPGSAPAAGVANVDASVDQVVTADDAEVAPAVKATAAACALQRSGQEASWRFELLPLLGLFAFRRARARRA